ncbi:MAG: DUF2460 domain-containing protein [Bryobacteraceae bacterium]|jgi:hypothetical protein
MATFPILKTGVVAQYPLVSQTQFATDVVRFIDGTEQRFRRYPAALHRWTVRLNLLDETELSATLLFFRMQRGMGGTFSFTDPVDGTVYPGCCFISDSIQTLQDATGRCTTVVAIQQNRS